MQIVVVVSVGELSWWIVGKCLLSTFFVHAVFQAMAATVRWLGGRAGTRPAPAGVCVDWGRWVGAGPEPAVVAAGGFAARRG